MRNSRERSSSVRDDSARIDAIILTVYTLLVGKGLTLLRLVPVQDQAIPEGKGSSSVSGRLIAVEEGARKRSLDMADSVFGEVVWCREGLGHLRVC
jgi:hypothetical protein